MESEEPAAMTSPEQYVNQRWHLIVMTRHKNGEIRGLLGGDRVPIGLYNESVHVGQLGVVRVGMVVMISKLTEGGSGVSLIKANEGKWRYNLKGKPK